MSAPALADRRAARSQLSSEPLSLAPLAVAYAVAAAVALPLDRFPVAAVVGAVLIALAVIDARRGVIPNRIVLPATALVLMWQLALFPGDAAAWILAPLLACALLAIPRMLGREWLGMGDVKLTALLGAALGWQVFGALFLAFALAFPVALIVILRGGAAARRTTIPFGPFLALGGLIMLLGPNIAGLAGS
jgi:prepilin signal peptidase PulO-like enzyme (type II secretory pathway)